LVAALPRACSEADRGEGLSEALAKHLQRIEVRLNAIEASTSDQVLVLEKLDVLKRNMERCGETLTEAANWSALVRECHASFANQQLRKVAGELEALRKSERVLRNVPGGGERTKTLAHLSEQLEKVCPKAARIIIIIIVNVILYILSVLFLK
jgi:GTPase involved in cell partitioning and DNA repair